MKCTLSTDGGEELAKDSFRKNQGGEKTGYSVYKLVYPFSVALVVTTELLSNHSLSVIPSLHSCESGHRTVSPFSLFSLFVHRVSEGESVEIL